MPLNNSAPQLPSFAGPLYMQVANMLRLKICASEWAVRSPLPNEVVLARDIGVSIGTMRKALELLEGEHLIERRQGRGTFVVETSVETELERFSNLATAGKKVRAYDVHWTSSLGAGSAEECKTLNLRADAEVYRLESVWLAETATTVEHITVSAARFPGLPDHLGTGGQFLFPLYKHHYREPVVKVTEALTCLSADDVLAARLNVKPGQAVVRIARLAFGMSGAAIELSRRTTHLGRTDYVVSMA